MESTISPQMLREWARHLLAREAVASTVTVPAEPATILVFEKLRRQLSTPVGVDGFRALATRALTLARSEVPNLSVVQVTAEGCLHGFSELEAHTVPDDDQFGDVGVIFIAQLLGLFLTFLGPATTQRLVQGVFPQTEIPTTESAHGAPFAGIRQEANNLRSLSERLESLASEHPAVEDGLASISENIRNTATLLDVFATIRSSSETLREGNLTPASTTYVM
jgi:hypothetical protein